MRISLPFPDRGLSPNARSFWAHKAKLVRHARAEAHASALAAGAINARAHYDNRLLIPLSVTITPPDRRHRDQDNMMAMLKPALDGIAMALKVNDVRFQLSFAFAESAKPGGVEVVL